MMRILPTILRVAFLVYPIVTNVAFEAFSCFAFEDGRAWLIADVSIECSTDAHNQIVALSTVAVVIYPVGLFMLNALLLFLARKSIRSGDKAPTTLSSSIHFLYNEYEPDFFWWELMEMLRRFFLVGVLVVVEPGSVTQSKLNAP